MNTAKATQHDRVRESSGEAINREADRQILRDLEAHGYQSAAKIEQRIEELKKEWDIERALEVNASTLAFTGVILGFAVNRKWLILPGIVTTFLLQHGVQGWCPPLPVLRKLGFRTRKEIDQEMYALKALRGDFRNITPQTPVREVLNAVR